jgi:hypothetical protein
LGHVVEIESPSTLREFRGQDAGTLLDLKSQNIESKSGPSILRRHVATIEAFEEEISIGESIDISGFRKSRILKTRRPEHLKSRNCKKRSGPSIIGGHVEEIKSFGKFLERKSHLSGYRDSENRRFGGQEVTYTSTSETPKSRKVIGLWSYKGRSYGPKSLAQGTSKS